MEVPMAASRSSDLLQIEEQSCSSLLITKKQKSQPRSSPKTFKLPPSSVLQNVRNFLPQMAAAQQDLDKRLKEEPGDNFDIENVDDCEKVIEMTLALVEPNSNSEPEGSDDSSDSDSDCCIIKEKDTGLFGAVTEDNLRLPGPKVAPMIEVIKPKNPSSSLSTQSSDSIDTNDTDMTSKPQ